MNKKQNHIGFLISYDWLPLFDLLSPKEFREVFFALIERQRYGTPIPRFESELANAVAATIEPTIQRRLNGRKGGLKTQKNARKAAASSVSRQGASEGDGKGVSEGDGKGASEGVGKGASEAI